MFNLTTFYHAIYVSFAFSVLLFGGLAFRQTLTGIEVRRLQLGEDREAFLSPLAVLVTGCLGACTLSLAAVCFRVDDPSIYVYALPLVFAVQTLQIGLRTWFQQTNVKTRGVIVRAVLLGTIVGAPFETFRTVVVARELGWLQVTITTTADTELSFRIFRKSWPRFNGILERSSACTVKTDF